MRKIISFIILIFFLQFSYAQELETLLLAADDARLLTKNYFQPGMKGLMFSMNNGWATTAKVHKKFGFDIVIGVNASYVPNQAKNFTFIPSDYQFVSLPDGQTELPTIMSDNSAETRLDVSVPYDDGTYRVGSLNMPGGITKELPVNAVPSPTLQIGFGLSFYTEIKARFVPNLSFNEDIKANLYGVGLQHDLTHYLGPIEKLPLSLSILGAFTNMKLAYSIVDDDPNDNVDVSNGQVDFKLNTWTIQTLASLDFKFITLYGGVGYNNGKTSIKMKGDYSLTYSIQDENGNAVGTAEETITDPINLDFDANGMRATLGARLNLGIFKIFADYTLQDYHTATFGIAFSVR